LPRHGIEVKASLEPAHRPQIQWKKIKKQGAIGLRRQGNHLALGVLAGVVVDPLQVGGLSAQTWTVVHQLAIDFARGKVNERQVWSARSRSDFYNIGDEPKATTQRNTCRLLVTAFLVSARMPPHRRVIFRPWH